MLYSFLDKIDAGIYDTHIVILILIVIIGILIKRYNITT